MVPSGNGRAGVLPAPVPVPSSGSPWARSPVGVGLTSVVLAVPIAVLGGAAGAYDDPKAWALPILVAATLVAWVAGARNGRDLWPAIPDRLGQALRLIVLGSAAWVVVSTVASVAPGLSVFGNFGRGMGLITTLAALALFTVVQSACRTREGVRSLVDAVLLGSAPVCLLALGQAAGWDPLPRAWDPAVFNLPVRSTLGQHIPLAGYLALLIPLAGARLDASWRDRGAEPGGRASTSVVLPLIAGAVWIVGTVAIVRLAAQWPSSAWALVPWGIVGAILCAAMARVRLRRRVALVLLGSLLAAHLAVVVASRARGPLLGLLLGLAVAGFALLVRRRAWKGLGAAAAVAVLVAGGLVLLNVPNSPLAPLAKLPLLQRLSEMSNARHRNPVSFRLQVWEGVLQSWGDQLRGQTVIPGTSPLVRSIVGYGPETELIALDPMAKRALGHPRAGRERWSVYYLVDRAHNVVLEQLMRGGLVGLLLWLVLVPMIAIVGAIRVGQSGSEAEAVLRLGGIAAIVAHVAELQVGFATATSLALFWIIAAWVTLPPWLVRPESVADPAARPRWRPAAVAVAALFLIVTAGATTRWLLASMAYRQGAALGIADRPREAGPAFERARTLMPWLPLPAEALVQTRLQLAGAEPDGARRAQLFKEGEAALADLRRHALPGATDWTLAAQLAFAQVRLGDRSKLDAALEGFTRAEALSPRNADIIAQRAWAMLVAGDPAGARGAAERALAISPDRNQWLAWGIIALAARRLGDRAGEEEALRMAKQFSPPPGRRGATP